MPIVALILLLDYNSGVRKEQMKLKEYNCSFTGYRPTKLHYGYDEEHPDCLQLKVKLAVEIEQMRKKGVTTFLSGMAQGTDIWCMEILLDLKRAYPDEVIRLIAVLPHEGQANRWSEEYRERYFQILAQADDVVTLQVHYTKDCMFKHNRYLVDSSAHLIAVYNGEKGGTQYTVDYATKKGLDIVTINPDTLNREHRPQSNDKKIIQLFK